MKRLLAYLALILCFASTVGALEANWPRALANVLVSEGGYSNDAHDPGGRTLNGVIQRRYDQYRDDHGLPRRTLTPALARDPSWPKERSEIYQRYYGRPCAFNELPRGLDYALFDYCVNSGIGRAPKVLQRILGLEADGRMGPETLAAVAARDTLTLIRAVSDERMRFLRGLSTFRYFGPGWTRRVNSVRAISLRMATPGMRGGADSMRPPFAQGATYQRIPSPELGVGTFRVIRPAQDPEEPEDIP